MTEDLEKRVQQAAQGITPQTKPDERRRYLGSLRERVIVRMDNSEICDSKLTDLFLSHLADFKDYTILINGKISNNTFLNKLEMLCSKNDIKFTLINDETAKIGAKDTAILVVSNIAVNKMRIEISQVYPPEMPKDELPQTNKKKRSIWQRLFHGENK